MEHTYCQELLNQELTQRKLKNSMYSLRAFARQLGIGSTTLSDVLAGKRSLSKANIKKVATVLQLSPAQISLMEGDLNYLKDKNPNLEKLQLEEDTFRLISEWHYLAILNLAHIKENKAQAPWIAKRLGISVDEAELALDRLLRLGLMQIKRGKMIRTSKPLTTSRDIPSQAIKKFHQSTLHLAEQSLFNDPVTVREFSSVTIAINPQKLKEAKDFLMKAKRKVVDILCSDEAEEVYLLNFQLFPLTRTSSEEKPSSS